MSDKILKLNQAQTLYQDLRERINALPTDSDIPEVPVQDVQVNGSSVLNNGVANVPTASDGVSGVVKTVGGTTNSGLNLSSGAISIYKATYNQLKTGTNAFNPVVPSNEDVATFYGLAKAAGDTTQAQSSNSVGTYTDSAKNAIQTMLDVPAKSDIPSVPVQDVQVNGTSVLNQGVANVPLASSSGCGVVKINNNFGIGMRSSPNEDTIMIAPARSANVKEGQQTYQPITPAYQHEAVFYGLAKASGDTTQAVSDNAVGTYTTEAKSAIHTMLGIDPASIAAQVDIPLVETVSGTTPTITGQPNVRYVCGEVSTISITPPASGSVDVIFESGSTATTMTVPSTVKWPAWFDAEALETDTTYEILITDGIYGSVMTWAT